VKSEEKFVLTFIKKMGERSSKLFACEFLG
jgi:hypothetical protein